MDDPLDYANEWLAATYGIDCAVLLAPIDASRPQGESLRDTPIWQAIRRAREADDSSLPLGVWVRRLKHADWNEVARATLDALASRTKDLQLSIWLAEALLHEHGFAGLATGVAVIDALCERYWPSLYPTLAGADLELRANLIHWLNERLIAPVRLVPLTSCCDAQRNGEATRAYSWADCEQLRRQQQATHADQHDAGDERLDADDFARALAATPDDRLVALHTALGQATRGLRRLDATLDRCFVTNAPGVGMLRGQLEQIEVFVATELRRRGRLIESEMRSGGGVADLASVRIEPVMAHGWAATALTALPGESVDSEPNESSEPSWLRVPAPIARRLAYAQLAEAAAALTAIEPHSPVPYLIRKAVQWGSLSTAQLYEELFIQGHGQLNVFELLGLGMPQEVDNDS